MKDGRERSGIYAIYNKYTADIYIGSAKNLAKRWSVHKSDLRANRHHSVKLQHSWNKYKAESFECVILEFCDEGSLFTKEQRWIDIVKPFLNVVRKVGDRPRIPSTENHFSGKKHSDESKAKMRGPRPSLAGKNNPMYGVRLNGEMNPMWGRKKPETAEFNRRTKKGKTLEEMHGDRADAIRESRTNRGAANGRFGKGRKVQQLTLDNELIAVYANAAQAAKAIGRNHVSIYHCLAKTRSQRSAYGYRWRYVE